MTKFVILKQELLKSGNCHNSQDNIQGENMKKNALVFVCMLILALSLSGICCAEDLDPLYGGLISAVSDVIAGKYTGDLKAYDDYSIMFEMASNYGSGTSMGYTLTDLDNDGVNELLFGENYPGADNTVLYDLYTIRGGRLVHVFDGWDRSRYYLSRDGGILYQGSSSAFESCSGYYLYSGGDMIMVYSVIYNAAANSDAPWFLSSTDLFDVTGARSIRENEALAITSHFSAQLLTLTPFSN